MEVILDTVNDADRDGIPAAKASPSWKDVLPEVIRRLSLELESKACPVAAYSFEVLIQLPPFCLAKSPPPFVTSLALNLDLQIEFHSSDRLYRFHLQETMFKPFEGRM